MRMKVIQGVPMTRNYRRRIIGKKPRYDRPIDSEKVETDIINEKDEDMAMKLTRSERKAILGKTTPQPTKYDYNDATKYIEGISICLTAWKTADYIEECLDSIENQTRFKTHDNFEVLLGIDACEETLAKVKTIMHKYRNLRVFMMDKNVGTYVTSNTIMNEAYYEWVLRFDTDDVMPSDMISKIFQNNLDNIDVVRVNFHNFGENNQKGLGYGVHMVRRKIFTKFGGYRNWRIAGDYDFIYRIEPFTKSLILNNVFYNRRYRLNGLQYSPETNMKSKKRLELHEFIKNKSRNDAIIKIETNTYCEIYNNVNLSNNKICFIIPNRGGQHLNDVI